MQLYARPARTPCEGVGLGSSPSGLTIHFDGYSFYQATASRLYIPSQNAIAQSLEQQKRLHWVILRLGKPE